MILFVYTDLSSFVKNDLEIIQRYFDVKDIQWTRTRDIKNMLRIIWHILRTDLTFVWFAGGHASQVVFFSKLFGKKSIVVVGGYEVANVPEINYGLLISPKSAHKVEYVLDNATQILPLSNFLRDNCLKCAKPKNIDVIYLGVNTNEFKPSGEKDNLVITIGLVTEGNFKRKGLEPFVRCAKFLPNTKFVLIGKVLDDSMQYLEQIATPNVEFISDEKLLEYCHRAKVYVQLSAYEGLGLSIIEAMSCECVPVVTKIGGMPEVVDDTGFYVPGDDPKATAEAIEDALSSDKGRAARKRIKSNFPLEKREKELVSMINHVLEK